MLQGSWCFGAAGGGSGPGRCVCVRGQVSPMSIIYYLALSLPFSDLI